MHTKFWFENINITIRCYRCRRKYIIKIDLKQLCCSLRQTSVRGSCEKGHEMSVFVKGGTDVPAT